SGVGAVGLVGVASVLPAGLLSPALGYIIDRYAGERVLTAVLTLRFLAVAFSAVSAAFFPSVAVVVVIAVAEGIATLFVRPTTAALLPSVTARPDDLVRAYAWMGTAENIGILIGPVFGGLLLATATPAVAMTTAAVLALVSAIAATRVRVDFTKLTEVTPATGFRQVYADVIDGVRTAGGRDVRAVVLVTVLVSAAVGASDVFVVPLAIDLLRWGDAGPGILMAVIAAGGLLSSFGLGVIGQRRLGPWFVIAGITMGIGVTVMAAAPQPVAVVAAIMAFGAGGALVTTASQVQIQSLAPLSASGRVLSTLEGLVCLALAAGVSTTAHLIERWSVRQSLLVLGAIILMGTVLLAWAVLRVDAKVATARERIATLDRIELFAPLPNALRERIATQIECVNVVAGQVVIYQGEYADTFYLVESGELEVSVDGQHVRHFGPDDFFGELALLADTPRTATVRAATDCHLWALPRRAFLTVLTGFPATGHVITAASAQREGQLRAAAYDGHGALARAPLLAALPADTVAVLETSATDVRCETATVLFCEGDPADDAYYVVEGQVQFEQDGAIVRTLGAGLLFGERAVLRPGRTRSATVTAAPGTVLLRLPGDKLRAAVSASRQPSVPPIGPQSCHLLGPLHMALKA
ncbi:MAG: MFS transporter, partial [Mycobacteriaceae bacterium]